MKGPFQYSLMLLVNLIFFYCQAQVGIGTNSPNAAAQLEVNSTNKGFLLPRLTATQRDGISNPPAGLMLFCTNCGTNGEMQFYDGTNWKAFTTAAGTPATYNSVGSDLFGDANYDQFGLGVALSADGNRVAVGAPTYIDFDDFLAPNHQSPGFVRIYEFGSGGWNQLGSTITGDANNDHSGSNIFLSSDGTTLAIGAPDAFSNIIKTGTVKIYRYTAGNWVQLGTTLSGSNLFDGFGAKVALSSNGNILTVGTPYYDNGSGSIPDAGRIQQFVLSGSTWMQTLNDITGTIAYDSYGIALSVSGDGTKVAVGVPFFGSDKGMVQVFRH